MVVVAKIDILIYTAYSGMVLFSNGIQIPKLSCEVMRLKVGEKRKKVRQSKSCKGCVIKRSEKMTCSDLS